LIFSPLAAAVFSILYVRVKSSRKKALSSLEEAREELSKVSGREDWSNTSSGSYGPYS
jgi:hypothetical protein